jgi:hypothetical protein
MQGGKTKVTCQQLTLHIGLPKTGTTTIQSFLEVNRRRLRKRGIFYVGPNTLRSYPQNLDFWKEERLRCGIQELKQRAKKERTNRILWSNEWLSTYEFIKNSTYPKLIQRELPASHTRVVIYLRRQDHRLGSLYLQAGIRSNKVPLGPILEFTEWLRQTLGDNYERLLQASADYAGAIQPWIDLFGTENVVVRVLEKGQLLNGNLLQDFCNAAEVPTSDCSFQVPDQNVSYNMELHDMLGMYKSVLPDGSFLGKMIRFIESQGQDDFFSRKFFSSFTIPPKCRIEILQRCEESNRKVAKEFLGREDGVLFREPWPAPDKPYQPYGGLTTEKLVPIFLHILRKQDDTIRELDKRLHSLPFETMWRAWKGTRDLLGKLKRGIARHHL